ncbi:MAG: sporulation protein YqfD [Oscillospiraceae bacterium]|nr:sporulation protein YqfD [Oscillospiraceae bacterium]
MLVLRIIRWCIGYVRFEINGGEAYRFFTSSSSRGFVLWQMERKGDTCCTACISARHYGELRQIARKRRLRLRILERHGLPFLLRKWKDRGKHGLFLGTIGAVILLCVLSTRVWVVSVTGNTSLSAEEIRQSAAEFGLSIGVGTNSYNAASVENQLMLRYPQISWVTVNDWGNTVTIDVREGDKRPQVEDNSETGNVTAARSGQILAMDVYHGQSQVKIGDGVAPGQLLVSGIWEHENGNVTFTKASAKIIARTHRQFTVDIPKAETLRESTGETVTRRGLRVFGLTIPLTLKGTPQGLYQHQSSGESLTINGVELPLTLFSETYIGEREYTVPVSKEEALERGQEALKKEQAQALGEDGAVLSEEVTVTEEDDGYRVTSDCLCREDIALEQPYFVELEPQETPDETESETD